MNVARNRPTGKRQSGKRPKVVKRVFAKSKTTGKFQKLHEDPVFKSASGKKISLAKPVFSAEDPPSFSGYRILDISILNEALKSCVVCSECGGQIDILELQINGLGSNFAVHCNMCEEIARFSSCKMIGEKKNVMELNRRSVYAMRCLGQGRAGLETFCGVMDLPPPIKLGKYNRTVSVLLDAVREVANDSMNQAAAEEVSATGSTDIAASFDGTWMKRGHTSLHGLVTCIGENSGKVIDAEVKSSHCKGCEMWKGKKEGAEFAKWLMTHKDNCSMNYEGSSGRMELVSAIDIFKRSQQKRGVRYVEYIGDGDTQSYLGVVKSKPYGTDVEIRKMECVGHIQKRMGTRLRKHKLSLAGKKLADGKPIGGRHRLTDESIKRLTVYYGNAIRKHKSSASDMRKAIWAIFYHSQSTDLEPVHDFCPKDADSWCGYNQAKTSGNGATYRHNQRNTIPVAVMDSIKPVFKDLASPQLLKRCLGGKTQNNNESINSLVWKFCPKVTFSGRKIVEIATNEAIIAFNDGLSGRLRVMRQLGCTPGQFSVDSAALQNSNRIKLAEERKESASLEVRRAIRMRKTADAERSKAAEGLTYGAGEF